MSFKMKTLALAAIAAMAMSGVANARIQDGSVASGSEFVFSAWDASAGVGYTYDLDWAETLSTVIGADTNYTTAVNGVINNSLIGAGGVIYDSVLTGINFASYSNVQWNLAASDNSGRTRLLVTLGDSAANLVTSNVNVKNANTVFNANYIAPVNGKGTHVGTTTAFDGYANTTQVADGTAYAGAASFGATFNGKLNDTSVLMGQSTTMWALGQNSSTTTGALGSAAGYLTQFKTAAGQDILASTYLANDGYHVRIAVAVPEPESYAMFLAGLGLMGFIARRRTQA